MPIVYLLDGPDIFYDDQGNVDVDKTFNTPHSDVARYSDEDGTVHGGTYGAFIAAPITPDLGSYVQSRVDDNQSESKRVELFRLPAADNQATVRFRFAEAGTDSWYWGVDDFGLYSIPSFLPQLAVSRDGNKLVIYWSPEAADWILEGSDRVSGGVWTPVSGVKGTSVSIGTDQARQFYRLRK